MPVAYASNEGEKSAEEASGEKPKTWGSTGITGLTLHIPSGIYYHRYSVKGRRTYRSLETRRFPTAKLRLARKSEEVETARQARREISTDNLRTLGDFEKLFLVRLETTPQTAATKKNYRVWLERLRRVWPEFETMLADRVTSQTLTDLRAKLQTARFHKGRTKKWVRGYKVGTINQTLLLVKLLLDLAREKRVIFNNPFNDDRGLFGKIFVATERKKLELPTHEDMRRIFSELNKPPAHSKKWLAGIYQTDATNAAEMARLMAFSGMRLEEANAARWEDLGAQRMEVRGTKSKSSQRIVPIIPALAALLEEIKARRVAEGKPLRGRILQTSTCLKALGRACDRLKLPRITQHGLRHYFATVCVESGVDVPTVSKWLGHSDGGAIAMRIYGHLRDEHSLLAAQKVAF